MPVLRTLSFKLSETTRITDALTLEYGGMLETVAFIDHLNVLSPFGRLSYDFGGYGVVELGFASGAPPAELLETGPAGAAGDHVQDALSGLAALPRVSLRDGHARVQRNETYEVGYRKAVGSRTYSAAGYQDVMRDTTVSVTAPLNYFASADLLPDFASTSSVFNLGGFRAYGYMGSVLQTLTADWSAALSAGESIRARSGTRGAGHRVGVVAAGIHAGRAQPVGFGAGIGSAARLRHAHGGLVSVDPRGHSGTGTRLPDPAHPAAVGG